MALVRLIYSSKKAPETETPDILRILDVAQEKNKKYNITGLLCFANNVFLQGLEGDSFLINRLYRNIIADSRHTEVCLIDYSYIINREFNDWAMGYVDLDKLSAKDIDPSVRRELPKQQFDPFSLDATRAVWLLKSMSAHLVRS